MKRTFIIVSSILFATACVEDPGPQVVDCGDLDTFDAVSNVLERRCGSLDCHGNLARPFRLYGLGGLRLATGEELADPVKAKQNRTVSGGKSTTTAEFALNWRSLCGLEPEKMSAVQAGDMKPAELMILRKPLGEDVEGGERHKGGPQFDIGDPGYVCLESWLNDALEETECIQATTVL